jgi:hypothetical protein
LVKVVYFLDSGPPMISKNLLELLSPKLIFY